MDQSIVSGVGNIYRAELLFRARISPFRAGNAVSAEALKALYRDAVKLMPDAMVDRRIVTTRAGGPSAQAWIDLERRGSLRLPEGRKTLLYLRHGSEDGGDGRTESLLVPRLPGRLATQRRPLNVFSLYAYH